MPKRNYYQLRVTRGTTYLRRGEEMGGRERVELAEFPSIT